MENKIVISIVSSIILALLFYPYMRIIDISDRVISLEKDKEYLVEIFNEKLKNCN